MKTTLRILFLAAEADPMIKIGGLGDVAGSLPRALRALSTAELEIDVRLAIPFYSSIQSKGYALRRVASFNIPHRAGPAQAEAMAFELDGLPVYLIGGTFMPRDEPVYSNNTLADGLKFTFFSLAALQLAYELNWIPDVVHANDWHTAPAVYALSLRRQDAFQRQASSHYQAATLMGLHNLPYLGVGAGDALEAFGLLPAVGSALPVWAQDAPLPLGLLSADHIVAASPTYGREILTPEFGSGLQDFLRKRKKTISGILNGLDIENWDPQKDPALVINFSVNSLERRAANKTALQNMLDLPQDMMRPLLAVISRLQGQKGIDLVPEALRRLRKEPWQAVILGTGDPELETAVQQLQDDFPERVRAILRYDENLSRCIYAGADMLLIPSRYEPCGLTQMIAMRYGCVPVARATGGLCDTITDYRASPSSTGFLFRNATYPALALALRRALQVYNDSQTWQDIQRCGMLRDFSWKRSAQEYLELYRSLLSNPLYSAFPIRAGG
jgi:starch synthase